MDLKLHFLLLLSPMCLYCGGREDSVVQQNSFPSLLHPPARDLECGHSGSRKVTLSRAPVCPSHWDMIYRGRSGLGV